jgi:hypothetical protein
MPKFVDEQTVFNTPIVFGVLPRKNIDRIPEGLATPKVANIEVLTAENIAPTTVTAFQKGSDGQSISIRGDGFTTIEHNTVVKTNTGSDKLLNPDLIYRFTYLNGVWYEDASGAGAIPLIVEGDNADYIAFFHNTDTVAGKGILVQNDGPLTNYGIKIADNNGDGYLTAYGTRLIQFGPDSTSLLTAIKPGLLGTFFSIEGDATYPKAGILLTSGDFKLTSMLYMTDVDRGMRLAWNYREPYQSGGTQMHSDPNYPVIQVSFETTGDFGINYTKPFVTGAGSWDGSGKTFKIFGGGYQEGVGPYSARGEYTSLVVGNVGRGLELGIANVTPDDYKMLFRMKGYSAGIPTDPIYLWVGGSLKNVQIDGGGFLKGV